MNERKVGFIYHTGQIVNMINDKNREKFLIAMQRATWGLDGSLIKEVLITSMSFRQWVYEEELEKYEQEDKGIGFDLPFGKRVEVKIHDTGNC